jgi:hypothetical protein
MFCICHHISTSFVSPFKVRDKTLQSWDSPSLLILFHPLHNAETEKYFFLLKLPKEADFGWPQILDEGRSE